VKKMLTTPQPKVIKPLNHSEQTKQEIERLVNNDVTSDVPHFDTINIAKLS
jgi:hypothetical protein